MDYFRLFEPFIVMAILMAAMWEPKPRKRARNARKKDKED